MYCCCFPSPNVYGRCQLTPHTIVDFSPLLDLWVLSCGLATVKRKPWALMNLSVLLRYPSH